MTVKRPATLADVARAAGVSSATVSRHLNAPGTVAAKTGARIAEAVAALGYTPDHGARAMATGRSQMVGAVVPTMENAIFARGLHAFQAGLAQAGYTLLVASHDYDLAREAELIRTFVSRGADGMLLVGQDRDPAAGTLLRQRGVPTVAAWTHAPDGPFPSVGFDNRAAMRALAEEVLRLGHRRIAMLSAVTVGNDRARLRVAGLRDAMEAEGLDPATLRVVEAGAGIAAAGAAFDRAMMMDAPPTALICGNDVLAAGAMDRARVQRIEVPRDVSITGFDDIDIAGVVTPPLTTVHVPHAEMGRRAAATLVEMIAGRPVPPPEALPATPRYRGTLSAPPRA